MSFKNTFDRVMNRYKRMFRKAEHKRLKRIYLGKEDAVIIKHKGLRKDSNKRKFLQYTLNMAYLRSYGKMKQEMLSSLLYGKHK